MKNNVYRFRRTQTTVDWVDIKADNQREAIKMARQLTGCASWMEPKVSLVELEVATMVGYGRKGFCKVR